LYVVDGWYLACFIAGMLLCELDILATSQSLPKFFTRCQPYKKSIFWTLFIAGIYLGGVPAHSLDVADVREAPGWYYLSFLKPQAALMPKAFYLFWAALFITASVPHLPWLQAFFELRFIQFLGKVSYGLYLVHGPVLWSVGDRVYAAVGWTREEHATTATGWVNAFPLPRFGPLGLEFNFVMAQIILFPITLWLAKVVTTCVDEPSIRFSQWAYKQVVQEIEEPKKSLKSES
jgi:peptidoglycan/LPS O-acetylase OafA/YrhL